MLVSLNRLRGMPVIWQARSVGQVERAVADVRSRMLEGLVVRRGIGTARWCPRWDVLLVGERCVLLHHKPGGLPEGDLPEMGQAFLADGGCAGEVTDMLICAQNLRLAALEICSGPFYRLMGKRGYAVDFCVDSADRSENVIVPRLLSWTQLTTHLEGEERK